jgi:Fe-S-cluster containining protein
MIMDADAEYEALTAVLRRLVKQGAEDRQQIQALEARIAHLLEVLVASGVLNDGHLRMSERRARIATRDEQGKVRLHQYADKYQVENADIDCAARIPLCHARCCALRFALSPQDLDEGVVRWELEEPYLIRQERDGFCTHLSRAGQGCTIHAQRPAPCRLFDCREDARVWIDFEKRIPAPMPDALRPPWKAG